MSWTIREAALNDAATIVQFINDMIAFHDMSHKYKAVSLEDFMQNCFGKNPWINCVVVERKEEPATENSEKCLIGFSSFYNTFSSKCGRGIYILDLFIIPTERSKGIGLSMMKYIAKISVEKGCSYMNWDLSESNKRAIDFYDRLGAKIDYKTSFMSLSGDALNKLVYKS